MTTPARATGRWRRIGRWLNDHPRAVGGVFLVLGVAWVGVVIAQGEYEHLPVGVVYVLAGVLGAGRETPRVRSSGEVVLPHRLWGGRRVTPGELDHVEVPASVWSTAASSVVLRTGERILLRGADRPRALALARELDLAVELVPESSA